MTSPMDGTAAPLRLGWANACVVRGQPQGRPSGWRGSSSVSPSACPTWRCPADAQSVVYAGVAVAAPCAIALGIHRYHPHHHAWALAGLGAGLMAAGEITWIINAQDGISGLADTLYLLGYVAMCGCDGRLRPAAQRRHRLHPRRVHPDRRGCLHPVDAGHRTHARRYRPRSRGGARGDGIPARGHRHDRSAAADPARSAGFQPRAPAVRVGCRRIPGLGPHLQRARGPG